MKNLILIVVSCSLLWAVTAVSKPTIETVERSFTVAEGGTLFIENDAGAIGIESHSRATVDIEVTIKGDDLEDYTLKFSEDDNNVFVVGERNGSGFWNNGPNASFKIKVPEQYNIKSRTGGGSFSLTSLQGDVDTYTSGGSIKLSKVIGNAKVKTSGGSIRVEEIEGNINAHTSGGSIKATLSKQLTEDSALTTSGGSVTVYLPSSVEIDLIASTSGGRVRSDFDVNGTIKKKSIKGTINGGGPELKLRTSGGSVSIIKL